MMWIVNVGVICVQLNQALAGKFNAHVHVEYEWRLQHEDLDESDEDLDEKVPCLQQLITLN